MEDSFENLLHDDRKRIDEIDEQMAHLFKERMMLVKAVAEKKKSANLPICDPLREAALKEGLVLKLNEPALSEYYLQFVEQLLKISKKYQADINDR